jgi:hypothetical protein
MHVDSVVTTSALFCPSAYTSISFSPVLSLVLHHHLIQPCSVTAQKAAQKVSIPSAASLAWIWFAASTGRISTSTPTSSSRATSSRRWCYFLAFVVRSGVSCSIACLWSFEHGAPLPADVELSKHCSCEQPPGRLGSVGRGGVPGCVGALRRRVRRYGWRDRHGRSRYGSRCIGVRCGRALMYILLVEARGGRGRHSRSPGLGSGGIRWRGSQCRRRRMR